MENKNKFISVVSSKRYIVSSRLKRKETQENGCIKWGCLIIITLGNHNFHKFSYLYVVCAHEWKKEKKKPETC